MVMYSEFSYQAKENNTWHKENIMMSMSLMDR